MSIIKMTELNLKNKRVLIREDFNVPISHGVITSDARIRAALFTIESAYKQGAKVILISHLGRPEAGKFEERFSLAPVAPALAKLLKHPVRFAANWLDGLEVESGEIVLCENVRFCEGEMQNDATLAKKMAALADIFVMDAFGVAHRAQASTYGVAEYAPIACAGPLLVAELEALTTAMENPRRPLVTIVGGSKISTKLRVLAAVLELSDHLIVGGGIANTLLAAKGFPIGKSLFEPDLIDKAKELLEHDGKIPLPTDVIVAKEITDTAQTWVRKVADVQADDLILDIGPETMHHYAEILLKANTIIWNGPVGVFEYEPFAAGTKALAQAIATSKAFSIAGGGDTLSAIERFNVANQISYISTGGGAFLEFLQKKKLPVVAILEQRALLNHVHGEGEGHGT